MGWRNVFKSQGTEIMENMEIILPAENKVSIISEISEGQGFNLLSDLDSDLIKAAGSDWKEIQNSPQLLEAFKRAYKSVQDLKSGITPLNYTKTVLCAHCGSVKLWEGCPDEVIGCPWCLVKQQPVNNRKLTSEVSI